MSKKKKKQVDKKVFQPGIDTGEDRPVRVRVAARDVNDRYSSYPSNGLNPIRLAGILHEADAGDVRRQMELYEEMEEKDAHLFSQLQTRKLAVTGLDWEVQPFSNDPNDNEIAEFVTDQLKSLDNFDEALFDMLDAVGKGISVSEIFWEITPEGRNGIEDIQWIHPKKIYWDSLSEDMKICTREYPEGITLPLNKFVIHKYKAKSGHDARAGVLRVVSWMYMFKNFDLKDWVAFSEVYGMPLRLGKYDASASEDDKKQLLEAIYTMGTDAAGIVPSTTMIEFIESNKTTSADVFERFARYADEQMSKAILGQTLSSDSGGGSYAQGKVHNDVRHDLTVGDAKSLATTVRRDLIQPLVEFNYGVEANIPLFIFNSAESEDLKETADIYKTLACDMVLRIPEDHIYKKFAIPKPEADEVVLKPPVSIPATLPDDNQTEQKQLKAERSNRVQDQLDEITTISNNQSEKIFGEMLKPILKIIDNSDSLEEVQKELKSTARLEKLYQEMDSPDLEDLVQQGIYIASLIGRTDA